MSGLTEGSAPKVSIDVPLHSPMYLLDKSGVVAHIMLTFYSRGSHLEGMSDAIPCTGSVVPSFRALSGRLKFTFRRHKFNKDSLLA